MSTQIQITPKAGITVGSTAVTSGTNNRLFFQSGGVVSQSARMTFDSATASMTVGQASDSSMNMTVLSRNANPFTIADDHTSFGLANGGLRIVSALGSSHNMFRIKTTLRSGYNETDFISGGLGNGYVTETSFMNVIGYNTDRAGEIKLRRATTVLAPSALSTDIAFRVRNSADTANLLAVQGNGSVNIGGSPTYPTDRLVIKNGVSTTIPFAVEDSAGSDYIHRMLTNGGYYLKGSVPVIRLIDTTAGNIYLSAENGNARLQHDQSFNFSDGSGGANIHTSMSTGGKWDFVKGYFNIRNTALTVTGITDSYQQYSADIVAGNAAPHFRTENGSVIKLYKQDLPTSPTNAQIATFLSNLGLANLI